MLDYTITRSTADDGALIFWTARTRLPNGIQATIGSMIISADTSMIEMIQTHPRYRRRGIATALLARAREDGFTVRHSPTRSASGDAWARSTGDPLPSRVLAESFA